MTLRSLLTVVCGICLGIAVSLSFCVTLFTDTNRAETDLESYEPGNQTSPKQGLAVANSPGFTLGEIVKISSPSEQRRETYLLFSNKNLQELLDFNKDIQTLDSKETHLQRILLESVLFELLVWHDPNTALDQVWTLEPVYWSELLDVVFITWSLIDLDGAVEAASSLDPVWKLAVLRTIFENRGDVSHGALSQIASKWNALDVLHAHTIEKKVDNLIDQPKVVVDLILNSDLSTHDQAEIATKFMDRWVVKADRGNLGPMLDMCVELMTNNFLLFSHLIPIVAAQSPKDAWTYHLSLSEERRQIVSGGILATWVRKDFEEARDAVFAMDSQDQSLVFQLYTERAKADPERAFANLEHTPLELRTTVLSVATIELLKTLDPSVVLGQLVEMERSGVNISSGVTQALQKWSEKNPLAAYEWLSENTELRENGITRDIALSSILNNIALIDPKQAFEIALQEPLGESTRYSRGMEFSVITTLADNGEFDVLAALLPRVREPALVDAYAVVGGRLISLGRVTEAIDLAAALPDSRRLQYFSQLASHWQNFYDSGSLIENLPSFPDSKSQSIVAQIILRHNEVSGIYSDEEIEIVNSYISKD